MLLDVIDRTKKDTERIKQYKKYLSDLIFAGCSIIKTYKGALKAKH